MSNARDFASRVPVDGALSNRNLIINGAMQVAQRGTSSTFTYGNYTLDRWRGYSAAAVTVTQEQFTAGQTDVEGYPKYYARYVPSTAAYNFSQRIEDIALLGSKTLTLSFWMKCSANKTTDIAYTKYYGSSGSSAETINITTSLNVTTSWQKFVYTFTISSNAGKTISGGNDYLQVTFANTNAFGSGETVEIAQVQLEVGDTATPFEHRSYSDELARCQRYYEIGQAEVSLAAGPNGAAQYVQSYNQTKRVNPSVTLTNSFNNGGGSSIYAVCPWKSGSQSAIVAFTADAEL